MPVFKTLYHYCSNLKLIDCLQELPLSHSSHMAEQIAGYEPTGISSGTVSSNKYGDCFTTSFISNTCRFF